ncbi:MAG: enoyl-CoA hydratase/isomerase family protein, partial [Candidatus Binatia bacterium]
ATVTFNRPESANALNSELGEEVIRALEEIEKDENVRALVFTGAGRVFSAGGDFKDMIHLQSASPMEIDRGLRMFLSIPMKIRNLGIPVIAKINGDAMGSACCIALACDLRIASEKARFGLVFTRVGLSGADAGLSYFLPRVVGLGKACELLLTGAVIDAKEAECIGLVNKVVPPDEPNEVVAVLANRLAKGPTFALKMTKKALYNSLDNDVATQLDFEAYAQSLCFQTEDHKEGVKAFLEKRKPVFKGK